MSIWHSKNKRLWERLRKETLNRQGWSCRHCGQWANEVDHVAPLEKGGNPIDVRNLQILCRNCHIRKTKKERGVREVSGSKEWDAVIRGLV